MKDFNSILLLLILYYITGDKHWVITAGFLGAINIISFMIGLRLMYLKHRNKRRKDYEES